MQVIRVVRSWCSVVGVGATVSAVAAQQQPIALASALDGRLDRPTRQAIEVILDSAARGDLPVAPLVDKALEGSAKRASGPRIIDAVRTLAADLRTVHGALGTTTDDPTLTVGVTALRAGVKPDQLRDLRDARNNGNDLRWPLTVLTDLVARGVPTDTAVEVIASLSRAGATDGTFRRFAADVVGDIAAGIPPGAAAVARAGVDPPSSAIRRRSPAPPAPPAVHAPSVPRAPNRPVPPHRPAR